MDYEEMEEFSSQLGRVLGLRITSFSLFVVIGAVIGLVMALRRGRRTRVPSDAVLWFAMLGIPLGLLCARLIFVLYNFADIKYYGFWYIFRMDCGGFTVIGAALGLLLAGWLTKKIAYVRFVDLMDTVLPGLLIVLAMERFGEGATSNGTGLEVNNPALQFFPLARPGIYEGMYTYAVHMFEGMTALVAGIYTQGMDAPRGRAAGTGLILAAAGQIVWESIRKDDRMMFDMASLLMIFCAIVLFALLIVCLLRLDWPWTGKAVALAGFLLLAVATGALQFFMEGKFVQALPVWLCFVLSCLTTAGLAWVSLRVLAAATEE
ncbi:MAG: prolipoprotein diacylglyceryl transferase [Clostridia bacterium]|nr:prolipoprotein diacylglyceryl transferase [Clostridia bacterium]